MSISVMELSFYNNGGLLFPSCNFHKPIQLRNTLKNSQWKTKRNPNFKQLYLKNRGEFRIKTNIFWKFIQTSSKQLSFLQALLMQ